MDSVAALAETSSMISDFPRTETGPESSCSQTPKLLLLAGETLAGEASSVDSVAALAETSDSTSRSEGLGVEAALSLSVSESGTVTWQRS